MSVSNETKPSFTQLEKIGLGVGFAFMALGLLVLSESIGIGMIGVGVALLATSAIYRYSRRHPHADRPHEPLEY